MTEPNLCRSEIISLWDLNALCCVWVASFVRVADLCCSCDARLMREKTRSIAFHLKSSCKCERARHLPALV